MNLFSNFCPQCGIGLIYNRVLGKMNKACSHCGRIFEREPGYFTGAMFLDSIFLPISAIPTVIILAYNGQILLGGIFGVLQMILISPFVFHYSRRIWVQLGHRLDSEK